MANTIQNARLFAVDAVVPIDAHCVKARLLHPSHADQAHDDCVFCDPRDVERLKIGLARHGFVVLRQREDAVPRLLPATIGLDVEILGPTPEGGWTVSAMPRPMPFVLTAQHAYLKQGIEHAVAAGQSVAFASPDGVHVSDFAAITRTHALALLNMRAKEK